MQTEPTTAALGIIVRVTPLPIKQEAMTACNRPRTQSLRPAVPRNIKDLVGEECREGIARGRGWRETSIEVGIAQRRRHSDVGGGAIE